MLAFSLLCLIFFLVLVFARDHRHAANDIRHLIDDYVSPVPAILEVWTFPFISPMLLFALEGRRGEG